MRDFWVAGAVLAAIGAGLVILIQRQRIRRIPGERLGVWLSFLLRPAPAGNVKAFRKVTTARLSETEYDQIRHALYTPPLLAEWDERETRLRNEFAIRAIRLEQVFRRQAAALPLSSEELELLAREGLRNETVTPVIDSPQ